VKLDFFFLLLKDFQHSLPDCQYVGALLGLGGHLTTKNKLSVRFEVLTEDMKLQQYIHGL
jgi:hypothetical protein